MKQFELTEVRTVVNGIEQVAFVKTQVLNWPRMDQYFYFKGKLSKRLIKISKDKSHKN